MQNNYIDMTYEQMANIVKEITQEVYRRDPDDTALYYLSNASTNLRIREPRI